MNNETLRRFKTAIMKGTCQKVEVASGILQFFFDTGCLTVMSAWRIHDRSEIIIASDANTDNLVQTNIMLRGSVVDSLIVTEPFHDLTLSFSGLLLQTFADADAYEHWTFFSTVHGRFIGGPGRLWSTFPNHIQQDR